MSAELSDNAVTVLKSRYLIKNESGQVVETPDQLFRRVAKAVAEVDCNYGASEASAERTEEAFYEMMTSLKFIPNSPTLMNAGTELGQLSACFVLPVEDHIAGIYDTLKYQAIIHKTGGGTGFSFSRLRPKGDFVGSTTGVASGPVSFMRIFNASTEEIKQGGKRRGANMGILRVDHPDILEFIQCKSREGELSNFNISVAVTDAFMQALKERGSYELVNPRTGEPTGKLDAREVFDKLTQSAWRLGDPGVVFIDRINSRHALHTGEMLIEATNPCGEQPLLPYESCNLGSVNLAAFYMGTPQYLERTTTATWDEVRTRVDWEELERVVKDAAHFLDNVIDANNYPIPQIEDMTRDTRKTGLGVMGLADLLYQLAIPYSSPDALELGEEIMAFIRTRAMERSAELGRQRGSFPAIERSVFRGQDMRNAAVTTVAPTGTIAMIAETSSGIEPNFSICYAKHVLDGAKLLYKNRYFQEAAESLGFGADELFESLSTARTVRGFEDVPPFIRELFETTFDVSTEQHVRMQAAFQKSVDAAVSKTVNMPNDANVDQVKEAYLLAYELGCKGITIYRDGSRQQQVLAVEEQKKQTPGRVEPRPRPNFVQGTTARFRTELGNTYITINSDEEGPLELFIASAKSGSSVSSMTEAIGRLVSLALRSGVKPRTIIQQLLGIKSSQPVRQEDGAVVFSIPDAVAKAMKRYLCILNGDAPETAPAPQSGAEGQPKALEFELCAECGGVLVFSEGCYVCRECGFSRCD